MVKDFDTLKDYIDKENMSLLNEIMHVAGRVSRLGSKVDGDERISTMQDEIDRLKLNLAYGRNVEAALNERGSC